MEAGILRVLLAIYPLNDTSNLLGCAAPKSPDAAVLRIRTDPRPPLG